MCALCFLWDFEIHRSAIVGQLIINLIDFIIVSTYGTHSFMNKLGHYVFFIISYHKYDE